MDIYLEATSTFIALVELLIIFPFISSNALAADDVFWYFI